MLLFNDYFAKLSVDRIFPRIPEYRRNSNLAIPVWLDFIVIIPDLSIGDFCASFKYHRKLLLKTLKRPIESRASLELPSLGLASLFSSRSS